MGVHDGHRDRKRDQFLTSGVESFAEHELLELLLFYGIPRKDTNPIAHELIDRFESLHGVLTAPVSELMKVPGISKSSAVLLTLVGPLYQHSLVLEAEHEKVLDTRDKIGSFFAKHFIAETSETMYQLCLDVKGKKLGCFRIGEGDVGSVGLNVRLIVENALLCRASLVALAHNHPSGVALPSKEDRIATKVVLDALDSIGIKLVDHFIIADGDYISMAESGYLL